jgi:hypothetical protein
LSDGLAEGIGANQAEIRSEIGDEAVDDEFAR